MRKFLPLLLLLAGCGREAHYQVVSASNQHGDMVILRFDTQTGRAEQLLQATVKEGSNDVHVTTWMPIAENLDSAMKQIAKK